jgi:PadR family transcriptional regulator, regulatory protein AphA
MSLRHALLALLTAQPMTGYDLAKSFHSSVGHVWHAPDSQIYPALRAMNDSGLVVGSQVPWGPSSTKTEYAITDAGIAEFRRWMSEPLEYLHERHPAHLRAAYFEWSDSDAIRRQLTAHIDHFIEQRDQWQQQLTLIRDRTHPIVARRLEKYPADVGERIVAFKEFSYVGLIAHADHEIAWAQSGLALVDELDNGSTRSL